MSPEVKQIFRVTALTTLGLFVGSLISGLIPKSVTGLVKGTAQAFASGVVSMGEASTFALTIGLIAVCTLLLACFFAIEVGTLLMARRRLRRNESTDRAGKILVGVERISSPLALGALGGLVIVVVAFEAETNRLFSTAPWVGPALVLCILFAAFIKLSLKRTVLSHIESDRKEKE